jgi:hypothetical protein
MNQANPTIAKNRFEQTSMTGHLQRSFEKHPARFKLSDFQGDRAVNNYLKSPEEIEAEFCLEMNNSKSSYSTFSGRGEKFVSIISYQDGQMNTYSPDIDPSGFMEENY